MINLQPKEKFILALEGKQPPGRVPHFELVFYLTMEAFGVIHPTHRHFEQWGQMSAGEKELHLKDIAETYLKIARHYEHSAIFLQGADLWKEKVSEDTLKILDLMRAADDQYCLMINGDRTWAIPDGNEMMAFITKLSEKPQQLKDQAQEMIDDALEKAIIFKKHGALDCFALCSDYCLNAGPFLSPQMFDEFVQPYLVQLIAGYRELGFYVIKHTDGNVMPILDRLVAAGPHAIHSLDPQGGVDMAEVKRRVGDQVCLIGNVNCGLMDTGTDEEVAASARYALKHGMPGGGYIFSTSNCIYTGMPLKRYDLILDVWRREGNYPEL
jgi:uroporphyrinogen decarboxylase